MSESKTLHYPNARHLQQLYCGSEENLARVEQTLYVRLVTRDEWLQIDGPAEALARTEEFFTLLNTGRTGDWASHDIEHEISGIYDVTHGAGLAVVFPAWMKYNLRHDQDRFVQWAVRVWNVDLDIFDQEATAREGIRRMEEFFHALGLGTRLADLDIQDDRRQEMAEKCTARNSHTVGNFVKLNQKDVFEILSLAQ